MVHGRCHHLPDGRRISDGSGLQRTMHPDFISGRSSVCHSGTHRIAPKLGYDPLGLLKGYVVGDWEYTHMLSTLGNNNWLSGYYSVMLPLSLSLFCKAAEEGRRAASILLGGGNVLVVMMLFLQGSDGGVMVACVTLWICFWSSRKKTDFGSRCLSCCPEPALECYCGER